MKKAYKILMRIIVALVMVALLLPSSLALAEEAPEVEWSRTYGGDNYEVVNSVQQTSDGGYILVGGTMSYGALYMDIWLVKTDADGNESWARTFGGNEPYAMDEGFSVQQTSDGGYIVTGYKNLTNWGGMGYANNQLWLLKTDSDGSLEWERDLGESVYYEGSYGRIAWGTGYSVKQTNDGGYVVVGAGQPRSDRAEAIFLIKTDAYGSKQWEQVFHGGGTPPYWSATARSVQQTSDGGYIIAGRNDIEQAPGDMWLIKTDTSGNIEWDKAFGREYYAAPGQSYPGNEMANSVQQTADGGYVIAGTSHDAYSYRAWVIKTNVSGEKIWDKTFEERWGSTVQQTSGGGYLVAGAAGGLWLGRLDSAGSLLWERVIETWGGWGSDGLQTTDGGYVLAGYKPGPGWNDGWLVKFGPGTPVPPATYTITATAGTGGSISQSGEVVVDSGASQTFSITPDAYYHISDVTVDGESVEAVGSYTFENIIANHTIHATFAPNAISGYVYDADTGQPIDGAAVVVWDYEQSSPLESPPEDRATTDSLGYYTTSALPDGEYRVISLALGHAVEFYSETFGWNIAQPVLINGQSVGGIDFTLGPGGTISGTITDADTNQPLSQVSLLARFADGSPGGLVTTTDENGNYVIRGLPYGTYVIQSPAPLRLGPCDGDYLTEFWQEKYSQEDADSVVVDQGINPSDIDFMLANYIEADIDVKPDSLNLKSKSSKNAVTAYIEYPAGYDVPNIDVSSVIMNVNGTLIAAQLTPTAIGDYDEDGVADLMVKFNRQDVINALDSSVSDATFSITGSLTDGTEFRGEDTVRLISK